MASLLHRIGRWCADHAWRTIAAWVVVLIALGGLASAFSTTPTSEVEFPGARFQQVMDDLGQEVPEVSGSISTAVFTSESGKFTPAQVALIKRTITSWQDKPEVAGVVDPFAMQRELDRADAQLENGRDELAKVQQKLLIGTMEVDRGHKLLEIGERFLAEDPGNTELAEQIESGRAQAADGDRQIEQGRRDVEQARIQLERGANLRDLSRGVRFVSEDGDAALAQIRFDTPPQSMELADRQALTDTAAELDGSGVEVAFSQDLTQETSVVGAGEVIGLATAGVVLLVMLGSLIVAGLPLLVALIGVAVAMAAAFAATAFFQMHSMTPALALMLGLAVGIDYALFIVHRHRTQVRHGMDPRQSVALATGTAGSAVAFAGATVIVALTALVLSGVPILAQMGLVAAAAVLVAVLLSLTLTPALLGLMGHRVLSRRAWRETVARRPEDKAQHAFARRYVRLITARPWATIAAVLAVVGLMAVPVADLRLGLPDGSSEPPGSSGLRAYTAVADNFGPGMNGPLVVSASLEGDRGQAAVDRAESRIASSIAQVDGVESVVPIGQSKDLDTIAFQVVLDSGPTDERTTAAVHGLLDSADAIGAANDASIGVTGQTVANIEISERLADALPGYLAVVVGLSLLILLLVFRSVVVPLIATGGFLLSVSAAFGATVAVFQWGWLSELFGVHAPGPIMSFGPILLIGVLFGLAMDYQMFLVSGMHEAHAHGERPRSAVRIGFVQGAMVVTAAAAIMFAVFGGFVFSHMVMIRPIGFGLAVGVLVDAVLVRMTLMPALMHLLGSRAWSLPKWLDRILPDLDVEGRALADRDETVASSRKLAHSGR